MHSAVHTQHIPIHRVLWERKGKKESKETEELGCVLILCVYGGRFEASYLGQGVVIRANDAQILVNCHDDL